MRVSYRMVNWDANDLFNSVRSTLYSKKYGVTLARFTHHKNNVIYASTKEDGKNVHIDLISLSC